MLKPDMCEVISMQCHQIHQYLFGDTCQVNVPHYRTGRTEQHPVGCRLKIGHWFAIADTPRTSQSGDHSFGHGVPSGVLVSGWDGVASRMSVPWAKHISRQ